MTLPWRTLFFLTLVSVTVLAWMPRPPSVPGLEWDKFNHLLAFSTLAVLARGALSKFGNYDARSAGTWLLAWGLLIELGQGLTATRHAEALDWLADGVGIALGLAVSSWVAAASRRRSRTSG